MRTSSLLFSLKSASPSCEDLALQRNSDRANSGVVWHFKINALARMLSLFHTLPNADMRQGELGALMILDLR
jgi:hypothetical protein